MIIPIRCFTCNKPIAHLWNDYVDMVEQKRKANGPNPERTPERSIK